MRSVWNTSGAQPRGKIVGMSNWEKRVRIVNAHRLGHRLGNRVRKLLQLFGIAARCKVHGAQLIERLRLFSQLLIQFL